MTHEAPQSRLILPVVSPYQGYQRADNVDKYPIDQRRVEAGFQGVVHTTSWLNQSSGHLKAVAKIDYVEMRNTLSPQAKRRRGSCPILWYGWSG